MKSLKTIENKVLAVLKEHPEARNDDTLTFLKMNCIRQCVK